MIDLVCQTVHTTPSRDRMQNFDWLLTPARFALCSYSVDSPPKMPHHPTGIPDERFIEQMVRCQLRLKAYLRSMIPDWNVADDVLQETNVVLWRKAGEFEPGTNFQAWAMKTAHFQVLAHRLKHRRERLCFNESLLSQLAEAQPRHSNDMDRRLEAMRACLETLPQGQRDMISSRYSLGCDSQTIARQTQRSAESVRVTLHRIRSTLLECIQKRLEIGRGG